MVSLDKLTCRSIVMQKRLFIASFWTLVFLIFCGCGEVHYKGAKSANAPADSVSASVDTAAAPANADAGNAAAGVAAGGTAAAVPRIHRATAGRRPASVEEEAPVVKGTAMVYAPANMIKDVPSIVNAVISKEELSAAVARFADAVQSQNPGTKKADILKDIKGDTVDIYQHMGVKLKFDSSDFREISGDEDATKDFTDKTSLEWEWVLKPLNSTRKSILSFMFYYLDPSDNQQHYIMEKTISVVVRVDARSFADKWGDFLLDDPKTTITAILIPFITFIGGLFFGKRKK
jgi:hypothetical protein